MLRRLIDQPNLRDQRARERTGSGQPKNIETSMVVKRSDRCKHCRDDREDQPRRRPDQTAAFISNRLEIGFPEERWKVLGRHLGHQ